MTDREKLKQREQSGKQKSPIKIQLSILLLHNGVFPKFLKYRKKTNFIIALQALKKVML